MSVGPHRSVSELRVRYAETDQMGVVYHAEYLVWCEIGRTDLIRRSGLSYAELERQGTVLAVAEANLRYHASARYDDLIRVETRLEEARSRRLTFGYVISRVGPPQQRLVSATTSLIALDPSGKPRTLPAGLLERLRGEATEP